MLDARGYSCPMPVIMVKKEIDSTAPNTLDVFLDSQCAVENVSSFAKSRGYQVEVGEAGDEFKLVLHK